jgi:dehydrogenase/reductase SDR family member 7B
VSTINRFSFFSSSKNTLQETTVEDFCNRNVLITGASSGLGRSIALLLATKCQCNIIILSARSVATLEAVKKECYDVINADSSSSSHQVQIHVVTADLSQPASVQQLAQRTLEICQQSSLSSSSSNTLDILINNGGVSSRSSFVDTDLAVDQQMMQINFWAGVVLTKAMIQHQQQVMNQNDQSSVKMIRKSPKGRVIWISSVQGKIGLPNRSSYAASKFAVQGYCECIRAELYTDPLNIYVHTVSPGYMRTNLSKSTMTGTVGVVHGTMDATTEQGMDPDMAAVRIINAVAQNQSKIVVRPTVETVS